MSYSVFVTPDFLLSAKINEDGDPETILSRENDKAAACSKSTGKPLSGCKFSKLGKQYFCYSSLLLGLDNLPQGYHNPFNDEVEKCFTNVIAKNTENCAFGKRGDNERTTPIEVYTLLVNDALKQRNGNYSIALVIPDQYRQQQRQMIVNAFPNDNIFLIHQSVAAAYNHDFTAEQLILTVRLDDGPLQIAVHRQRDSGLQTLASLTDATLSGLRIINEYFIIAHNDDGDKPHEIRRNIEDDKSDENEDVKICDNHRMIIYAAIQQCLAMADCDMQDIDQVVLSGILGEKIEGIKPCIADYTGKEVILKTDEDLTLNALLLMNKQKTEPGYLKQCLQTFMTVQAEDEMRAISNLFQSFPSRHEKIETFAISNITDETIHVMENSLYDSTIQRNCQIGIAKAINHNRIAILKFSVDINYNGIISLEITANNMDIQPRDAITFA